MRKILFLIPLAAFAVTSCKPTNTFPKKSETVDLGLPPWLQEAKQSADAKTATGQNESGEESASAPDKSLLRVNVTQQGYNFSLPWKKKSPEHKNGLGVLLEGGVILTTAEMVADAAYISFADPEDSKSFPAKVVAVDYEANLALLRPQKEADISFLKDMVPMKIGGALPLSSSIEMWQLGGEGLPLVTEGKLQNYEMSDMMVSGSPFLIYRAKAPLQNEQNSFTMPVIHDGELAGILVNYNSRDQISEVIDSSVIKAFVKDALDGEYKGFPGLGVEVSETTDPAFRRYLKLEDDMGGVFVNKLEKSGCGARAGLKRGDVILSVDGHDIDSRGYYKSPEYGKLDWLHLINGNRKVGEVARLEIMRGGKVEPLDINLETEKASSSIIPRYMYDKAPNYLIHGGLVFSELTAPYLDSFGGERASAPATLVAAAGNSADYEKKGLRRIVVLNGSIPSAATLGYESIPPSIVESVDGKPIKDLQDLARALDEKGQDIKTIGLTRAPYKIYVSGKAVEAANETMKKRITPQLRRLES